MVKFIFVNTTTTDQTATIYFGASGGCTDTVLITVKPMPSLSGRDTSICNGSTVDLTSLVNNYGTYLNPVWKQDSVTGTTVGTPTTVTPSVTTTYYLTADSSNGCKATISLIITVNLLPDFTLSKPVACPGGSEEVNITGLINAVPATAQLKIDAGSYTAYPSPATLIGLSVGNHTITVKNAAGCETAKNITINAVQPNNCIPVVVTRSVGNN